MTPPDLPESPEIVPPIAASDLSAGYAGRKGTARVVCRDVNVALQPGELVALLGPNGAGKTTLLRTLAGLQPPLAGSVHIGGDDARSLAPPERARRLSLVLTERAVPAALSVQTVVALGRHPHTDWTGRLAPEDQQAVEAAIAQVGLEALAHRPVGELSDGERQRVMIARALAQAGTLLLDEPTAHLDLPGRLDVMRLLYRLTRDAGRAVLLVTHELDLALRVADRLWLLGTDGRVESGVPEALVLDGRLARAFAQPDDFDPLTGSLRLHDREGPTIRVTGDEPYRTWTARAVERLGWRVADVSTHSVRASANGWLLRVGLEERYSPTLDAVLAVLRRIAP